MLASRSSHSRSWCLHRQRQRRSAYASDRITSSSGLTDTGIIAMFAATPGRPAPRVRRVRRVPRVRRLPRRRKACHPHCFIRSLPCRPSMPSSSRRVMEQLGRSIIDLFSWPDSPRPGRSRRQSLAISDQTSPPEPSRAFVTRWNPKGRSYSSCAISNARSLRLKKALPKSAPARFRLSPSRAWSLWNPNSYG